MTRLISILDGGKRGALIINATVTNAKSKNSNQKQERRDHPLILVYLHWTDEFSLNHA